MHPDEQVIAQTKKWITDVVIGCNFCPFASREVKKDTVRYVVEHGKDVEHCLQLVLHECIHLDIEKDIVTTLIIFPESFKLFFEYLDFVDLAERLLKRNHYEGVYQLASFHPDYVFADAKKNDAANYTNRSVYPMIHLLRETSIDAALENFPNAEEIPDRNIRFAREKGEAYMKMLRDACL